MALPKDPQNDYPRNQMKPRASFLMLPLIGLPFLANADDSANDRWSLARQYVQAHRFSTLFTAQDVRRELSQEEGLRRAIEWCKATAVTRVYLESFRDGYQAERGTLIAVRDRFLNEGFLVSGCVTPTRVGKSSTGWKETISCYTDAATQSRVREIFTFTAALFEEIMIDDFWFTDCECDDCDRRRKEKVVQIGSKSFPVRGHTWEDYRCELMVQLSREHVLAAAKAANPRVTFILKYPQWYDRFHERGYEVARQTTDFDRIWVGTETRDYDDARWGGTPQYEAYFIMRWLGGLGGAKCGGGWFDPYGTTEATYIEQARQTILAGARESVLFCYGSLQRDTGPRNILALRRELPDLLQTAAAAAPRRPVGIAAYKPANSHPGKEPRVFDFVGMLGFPLLPCHEFPSNAPAAFFSVHALKDPQFPAKLAAFVQAGRPVLLTDALLASLPNAPLWQVPNVCTLPVRDDPKSLLHLPESDVARLREILFKPLRRSFSAPNRVSLYLYEDGSSVIENFNDREVRVELDSQPLLLAPRSWHRAWK